MENSPLAAKRYTELYHEAFRFWLDAFTLASLHTVENAHAMFAIASQSYTSTITSLSSEHAGVPHDAGATIGGGEATASADFTGRNATRAKTAVQSSRGAESAAGALTASIATSAAAETQVLPPDDRASARDAAAPATATKPIRAVPASNNVATRAPKRPGLRVLPAKKTAGRRAKG